jgi:predicted nucleic acid-binding protein
MRFVIDASIALRWVLEGEEHKNADTVLREVLRSPEYFAVPELFGFEVLSVLVRLHPDPFEACERALKPVLRCGLLRYPLTDEIIERSIRLSKSGLTGYDAAYAALAEELDGCWMTFDVEAVKKIGDRQLAVNLFSGLPENWSDIP